MRVCVGVSDRLTLIDCGCPSVCEGVFLSASVGVFVCMCVGGRDQQAVWCPLVLGFQLHSSKYSHGSQRVFKFVSSMYNVHVYTETYTHVCMYILSRQVILHTLTYPYMYIYTSICIYTDIHVHF